MSSLRLRLVEKLKASQPLTGMSLFITPAKGRGVGRSGTAIVLPEPVQFLGKELALAKEPDRVCFGRAGTARAKCCLKTIGKCDTETHERTKCTKPEHSSFLSNFTDRTRGHSA